MVLEIAIGPKADRFLQSVNQQIFDRLSGKIKELAVNPQPRAAKKVLNEEGVFRVRVGMHRILFS
jgi:mRNA-degrading endonuclease RelE of RelBE toxin-antitoxin system